MLVFWSVIDFLECLITVFVQRNFSRFWNSDEAQLGRD